MLALKLRTLRARALGFDDAPLLQRFLESCGDYFRAADGRAPDRHAAMERIADALGDDKVRLFGLAPLDEKRWCGLLHLRLDEPAPREATIVLLLLEPSLRRRGAGREVVDALLDALRREGVPSVHLGVQDHEEGAHAFWKSMGFSPDGRDEGVTRYARKILKSS